MNHPTTAPLAHRELEAIAATEIYLSDTRTYLTALFRDLATQLPLVHALLDTRTRGLGFLGHDQLMALGDLVAKERQIRRDNARLGFPEPSGNIPTPVTLPPLQVLAEATFTLQHLARRGHGRLERAGLCPIGGGLPGDATPGELLVHVSRVVAAINDPAYLDEVTRELEHLVEISTRAIDGNDRVRLTANCPHCDRRTLVVEFATGVIRCDREPKAAHYAPCTCPDSYCDCHAKPVTYRHTWHRTNVADSKSWWALADRLNLTRLTSKENNR